MKNTKLSAGLLAALLVAGGTFGLAGCATDSSSSGSAGGDSSTSQDATNDVATDLETARQAVIDGIAAKPGSTQIMLAGDVSQPTEKYGMLVMPFVKTDAAERVTGTVTITDGAYVIEAESAATGDTWQIDQDGNISKVE